MPGALIVRAEYAKEQPQNVARFLAVYLRALEMDERAPAAEAIAMMKKFYEQGGVTISEASMKKEFDTRPVYDLAGQLKIMNRAGGASDVDKWLTEHRRVHEGERHASPRRRRRSSFVTDEYMRMVDSRSEAEGVRQQRAN